MIPVDQTIFEPPHGECFYASIASILEIGLGDMPDFWMRETENWLDEIDEWVREERGLAIVDIRLGPSADRCSRCSFSVIVPVLETDAEFWWIASGHTVRTEEWEHSVVYRGDDLAHDPHPSRAGLKDVHCMTFFVPCQPWVSPSLEGRAS